MSAKESSLPTTPIFTYVIPKEAGQPASLINGVMITLEGVITFFARDTLVCKNSQGEEGQITNEALETVLNANIREAWLHCFSSSRGYLMIEQEDPLHSGLHRSALPKNTKIFDQNNHHMHMATPVLLQPEVLRCILDALATAQADVESRQRALNSLWAQLRIERVRNLCQISPIVDINRPAIPENTIPKLIKTYSEFFEKNKETLLKAHNTTCTDDYLRHFPHNRVQEQKQTMAQVSYFFSHIGNTAYSAFFNAAIFSFVENILKECARLEPAQINYLKNSVLLPALLSSDMEILLFAVIQMAQATGSLAQNGSTVLTIGMNASLQLLQAESTNDMTTRTQVFSALAGSVTASIAAGCANIMVSSTVSASKSVYSYFFPSSIAVPGKQQNQTTTPAHAAVCGRKN